MAMAWNINCCSSSLSRLALSMRSPVADDQLGMELMLLAAAVVACQTEDGLGVAVGVVTEKAVAVRGGGAKEMVEVWVMEGVGCVVGDPCSC